MDHAAPPTTDVSALAVHAVSLEELPVRDAPLRVRDLGRTAYEATLKAMREFTAARDAATADELWLTEHPSVYTLGLAGKREHVLDARGVPVVQSDRGGQVTWHGPGQAVVYLLVDLKRRGLKVRELVQGIEAAVIRTLETCGVQGCRRAGMPGVYVDDVKIAALGLKVTRGATYHGVSLNVDNDLAPFAGINPCGYAGLATTSLVALKVEAEMPRVRAQLAHFLQDFIESHPQTWH